MKNHFIILKLLPYVEMVKRCILLYKEVPITVKGRSAFCPRGAWNGMVIEETHIKNYVP